MKETEKATTVEKKELPSKPISAIYRLIAVKDVEFHVYNYSDYKVSPPFDMSKVFISSNWQIRCDVKTKTVTLFYSTFFMYRKEDNIPVPFVNYFNGTSFQIENYDDIAKHLENNTVDIPDQIIETFLSIAISTARGILIEKLARTEYANIFIPVATPDFIQNLVKRGPSNQKMRNANPNSKKENSMTVKFRIVDAETKIPIEIPGKENKFDSYEKADESREELQRNGNILNLDIATEFLV